MVSRTPSQKDGAKLEGQKSKRRDGVGTLHGLWKNFRSRQDRIPRAGLQVKKERTEDTIRLSEPPLEGNGQRARH